jgi:hypothetical protein
MIESLFIGISTGPFGVLPPIRASIQGIAMYAGRRVFASHHVRVDR